MATVILWPQSVVSNDWTIVGTGTADVVLLDNDYYNYLKTNTDDDFFELIIDDLDSAVLNIDTITSIQVSMFSDMSQRSTSAVVTCDYRNAAGAVINSYTEDITINATGNLTNYTWTARTTYDGSHTWKDDGSGGDGQLDGLRLRVTMDTTDTSGAFTFISQMYLTVTYTELPTLTYPSDDNVILKNGLTELKNGLTIIK